MQLQLSHLFTLFPGTLKPETIQAIVEEMVKKGSNNKANATFLLALWYALKYYLHSFVTPLPVIIRRRGVGCNITKEESNYLLAET